MLFTSSYSDPGQRRVDTTLRSRPCPTNLASGVQPTSCLSPVGSRSERCLLTGPASEDASGSKPDIGTGTQMPRIMKHERKHQGAFAIDVTLAETGTPGSAAPAQPAQELPLNAESVFNAQPSPRQPETPEEESFRRFLKTHLPRHKASPALLQRIRSTIQEEPLL